jgi:hypothetical protein
MLKFSAVAIAMTENFTSVKNKINFKEL